jgi:hypothetical protein
VKTLLVAIVLLAIPAVAQAEPEFTAISIGAPESAQLGDVVTLQARLVDRSGLAISKTRVDFLVPLSFLDGRDDVVVASALTNQDGLAVATWRVRSTGTLTVQARFIGDANYGGSAASTTLISSGDEHLYAPTAGVQVPVINEGPLPSAWLVVAVLAMVWSLYGIAAAQLFRISRSGRGPTP